jgi:hypothetical protein
MGNAGTVSKDSSFSEEKEAKRLLDALRGPRCPAGLRPKQGARATTEKSLFASFSSEKEDSSFTSADP